MTELVATYELDGKRHTIELVEGSDGQLLVDHIDGKRPRLIAALAEDEGEPQAVAAVYEGGYLERARAGEQGLATAVEDRTARRRLREAAAEREQAALSAELDTAVAA